MENYFYSHTNYQRQSSRIFEITILSAEDLQSNKRPTRNNAFVTVRSEPNNFRSTAVDEKGGSNPWWNEKLFLDVSSFAVEVRCKTAYGDKLIGSASVPASDISGGYAPESCLHFLSYRLRSPSGERNGIINISVRTKALTEDMCTEAAAADHRAAVGLPVGNHFGGVVTGVPVRESRERKFR